MKRWRVLTLLLVVGFLTSCASGSDLQVIRADIEQQRLQRDREVESRLQDVNTRVAQLEKSQEETRRDLARTVATSEEVRVEIQRLRGTLQETRRGAPAGEIFDTLTSRITRLENRLAAVEGRPQTAQRPTPAPSPPPAPSGSSEQMLGGQPPPIAGVGPTSPDTSTLSPGMPQAPSPTQQQAVLVPPPPPPPPVAPPPPPPTPRPPPPTPPSPPAATTIEDPEAERTYQRALREYQQGGYDAAMTLFRQFLRQYPKSTLAGKAQYWIGESLYGQKQFEAAIVAFDEVNRKYPRDEKVASAMLKQGFAFAELGDKRNARYFLEQVQKKYPNSSEAQLATEKLKQLRR